MGYCIGIGITNRCNYNCDHCYSRLAHSYDLTLDDIKIMCRRLDIGTLNLGTGESILHPDFDKIIDYLHQQRIKISLTTNGLSVLGTPIERLKTFNDIDFSIDFPSPEQHNHFRGERAYENVMEGIGRCKDAGIECSIVMCLMNVNYLYMEELVKIAASLNVNLRINVYKPVHSTSFSLSYTQFWKAIRRLFQCACIISCSEPIVNAAIKYSGTEPRSEGILCGKHSFRIHPDKTVRPCVYWPYAVTTMEYLDRDFSVRSDLMGTIPEKCMDCAYVNVCGGGCPARRIYRNIREPDEYCPFRHHDHFEPLRVCFAEPKDLVHSNYLCTIIAGDDGK